MKKLFLLILIVAASGCATIMPTSTSFNATLSSSTFAFTPPSDNSKDTGKMVFLFINPRFSTGVSKNYQIRNPFKTFVKNMSVDFLAMLTAKGMLYKGPYESYEEVVYDDKNQADLCLETEVDIQFTGSAFKFKKEIRNAYGAVVRRASYYYDGQESLIGKLNLFVYEPHTHVKLWIKSIPLKTNDFYLKSQYAYDGPDIPLDDPGVWSVLVDNMNQMYNSTMTTAWNQLDMRELRMKRAEARQIGQKAGYINQK
jgi:hypothetical protein